MHSIIFNLFSHKVRFNDFFTDTLENTWWTSEFPFLSDLFSTHPLKCVNSFLKLFHFFVVQTRYFTSIFSCPICFTIFSLKCFYRNLLKHPYSVPTFFLLTELLPQSYLSTEFQLPRSLMTLLLLTLKSIYSFFLL